MVLRCIGFRVTIYVRATRQSSRRSHIEPEATRARTDTR